MPSPFPPLPPVHSLFVMPRSHRTEDTPQTESGPRCFLSAFSAPDGRTVQTPNLSPLVPPATYRPLAFRYSPPFTEYTFALPEGQLAWRSMRLVTPREASRYGQRRLCPVVPTARGFRKNKKRGRHGRGVYHRMTVTRRRSGGRSSGRSRPAPAASARQYLKDVDRE
jgi:hypothetical protein